MVGVNVRRIVYAALVASMLGAAPFGITVTAQESTPEAEESGMPVGFASETLALALIDSLPATPAILMMDRLTLDAGAVIPGDAGDATLAFVLVEEGAITVVSEGPLQVTRADDLANAMAGEPSLPEIEEIAAGETAVLTVGDSIAFPPGVAIEMRNDTDEPAVLLGSLIVPAEGLIGE